MKIESANYLQHLDANTLISKHGQDGAIQAVSEQFEAQFLQTVLKHMRSANEVLAAEDSALSSMGDSVFQDMYDSQLALSLSGKTGSPLVEALTKQLGGEFKSETSAVAIEPQQPTTKAMQQAVILPFVVKDAV
ncbi:rod-binding protein [Ferrimonas aestuarii]|uniref:Peptidoglycan hydrolase n=1 Tax=Ferrimonas aestuarii TaxID=2569539 RepID=A0A4U1BND0_9GAMM|nr:rod-binding protein [Ferrimonas aestuarii]TKB54586.1 peptidoglycan hydrolase [Ferrimonas aestuarii]